jgi:hypothetical protein
MVFSIAVHTTLFVQVYTADFTGGLTFVYRRRGLKSRPTLAIFILISISFTLATIYWAALMATLQIQIRSVLVKNVGMELSDKIAIANAAMAKPVLIQLFCDSFLVS